MKTYILFLFALFSIISCKEKNTSSETEQSNTKESTLGDLYYGTGNVTQGLAETQIESLINCNEKGSRISGVGIIKDTSGKSWTVPGTNHFNKASKAFDLYNECNNITPESLSEVDINTVPVYEVDADGDIITGYIFADNYFELYINGKLIAIDPVPFTPFNSNIVKFKVKTPYTIAVKLIDWEEHLGLGSENNRGKDFHPGDGGFIASFSDGTVTSSAWKAQTFYTAPISDLSCLSEDGDKRLSKNCNTDGVDDGTSFYGIHWDIPEHIFDSTFDDSQWPNATPYTEDEIGVNNKKSYMNFIEKFSGVGAEFIWSTNVILDNEVIVRYQVK
ncbi:hypothetical protein [Formosa sp. PL04]|uniref:hypothetical protein n=1 Tax=Formosa sp. PL04 TaxID=3081755 RepID=UPI002980A334|nr:hypothetical protein [Formosa sp. PL04]MDW5288309.1 hypothetical protein [Formosa sp. PL04]